MPRYIAFLRGVNVGGNNKVSMAALKALMEGHGYGRVVTYINSGNILFSSDGTDTHALQLQLEALIQARFSLKIPVTVVPGEALLEAMAHAPAWWNADKESKHNAIFVIPPTAVETVFETVGPAKPEYEQVAAYGRVIFWSAPVATFSRTRWLGIVGSRVCDSVTIRNANTVTKLAQLLRAEGTLA